MMSAYDLGLRRWKASIDEGEPLPAVVEPDEDVCSFCGKHDQSEVEMGTYVSPCRKCEMPVCDTCAEVDYDFGGDPGGFFVCQWDCPDCRKAVA